MAAVSMQRQQLLPRTLPVAHDITSARTHYVEMMNESADRAREDEQQPVAVWQRQTSASYTWPGAGRISVKTMLPMVLTKQSSDASPAGHGLGQGATAAAGVA